MVDYAGQCVGSEERIEDREPHRRARIKMEIQEVKVAFGTRKSPASFRSSEMKMEGKPFENDQLNHANPGPNPEPRCQKPGQKDPKSTFCTRIVFAIEARKEKR